jgi:integrase
MFKSSKPAKPSKPSPDFPLFPHASGQWAKKIQGKTCYFGPWADPEAARTRYQAAKANIIPMENPEAKPSSAAKAKPSKPYPDFPLTQHPNGRWCKRIRGQLHYFGPVNDWKAALKNYQEQREDLYAGRKPQPKGGLSLHEAVNAFLESRERRAQEGAIKSATVDDYADTVKRMFQTWSPAQCVQHLLPSDFARLRTGLARTRRATALKGDIIRVRVLFNFVFANYNVQVKYGSEFAPPTKAALRRAREARGPRFFPAVQIHQMLAAASIPLRAMIWLGINCGFGNEDCATLTLEEVDWDRAWHHHSRPKTGVLRRCPLWPQTVAALRAALAARPTPRERQSKLVFVTRPGRSWSKTRNDNPISKETAKLLQRLGLHRPGLNFYALRHTFQTIGEEQSETVTRFIMGHTPRSDDMAAVYREWMGNDRIHRVTDHVYRWLFASSDPPESVIHNPGRQTAPAAPAGAPGAARAGALE